MNILHFKCSLHVKQHIVMFVLFCNELIIVPMKSVTYSNVSLVNESAGVNDFRESVINNPFIPTAASLLNE